jgi:hypothetical protein
MRLSGIYLGARSAMRNREMQRFPWIAVEPRLSIPMSGWVRTHGRAG